MPSRRDVLGFADAYGFESILVTSLYQRFASSYDEYCQKIGQRGLSALVAISDEDFAAGMQRLKEWTASKSQEIPAAEPIDLFVFRIAK